MTTFISRLAGIVITVFIISGCATQMDKSKAVHQNKKGVESAAYVKNKNAQALYQAGRDFHINEQYAQAIEAYEGALAINADYYDAYNGLGVVYSTLGEHELAVQMIAKAVRLAPLASFLHNNLGFAYMQQGRASEAAGAFQRALQLNPENTNARSNLLAAYHMLGCAEGEPCGQWQEPQ